jgi:hypothetical protein
LYNVGVFFQKIEKLFKGKSNSITHKQNKEMEHVRKYERRDHADLKWGINLHPANGEGRVGASGIDKTYTLPMVMALAYQMVEKPNIIIKAGENAKWYIKKCPIDEIDREIAKMLNSAYSKSALLCTMHIIEWAE